MERFDLAVVGAGIVGLAIARAVVSTGARVALLEQHEAAGMEQSTHNSQVIHSGIFARPGTLRAQLNLRGNALFSDFADELDVPFDRCGTLVVATKNEDLPRLSEFLQWGRTNGVVGLRELRPPEVSAIEPHLTEPSGALFAATGGRVDSGRLVRALDRRLKEDGADRRYGFRLRSAYSSNTGWTLGDSRGNSILARRVVNSAGVACARVARLFGVHRFEIYPCLGEYARVRSPKNDWIRTMVYTFPPPGYPGIGVHLTRLLSGELLIGPTATYQKSDHPPALPETPLERFLDKSRPLLPDLQLEDLEYAPAGVRAKPVPPNSPRPFEDFVLAEEASARGVLHLIGLESPGLTASPAVAEYVCDWFDRSGRRG